MGYLENTQSNSLPLLMKDPLFCLQASLIEKARAALSSAAVVISPVRVREEEA